MTDRVIERLSAIYLEFDFVPRKTLIFLDEIQMCPNTMITLKSR